MNHEHPPQKDSGFLTYPTSGWRRAMFKWPVQLWRLGLGPWLGRLFILITHTGRKSGLPRRTLVELHRIDGKTYAPSGFGRRSQWYRNIEVDPRVTIQTAAGTESCIAIRVTNDKEMLALLHEMGASAGQGILKRYLKSLDIEPTDADILAKKDRIYWLRFDPTDEPTPLPLKADLIWVWPLLGLMTAVVALLRFRPNPSPVANLSAETN